MKTVKALSVVFAALIAAPVLAQNTSTLGIDKRQENQQKRIDAGVQSGALTEKEAAKLEKRDAKIDAHEQVAKADGSVTRAERRKLHREQNRANRGIYRKKHNGRTAG